MWSFVCFGVSKILNCFDKMSSGNLTYLKNFITNLYHLTNDTKKNNFN